LAQRGHNFGKAIALLRDVKRLDRVPDARLYEIFLEGCMREGLMREEAKRYRDQFKRYPKGVQKKDHEVMERFCNNLEKLLVQTGRLHYSFIKEVNIKPFKPLPCGLYATSLSALHFLRPFFFFL